MIAQGQMAKIVNEATGHVFTIEECRKQCEVTPIDSETDSDGNTTLTHPDDGLILAFLDAAVEMAEDFTGLSIATRTYEQASDSFIPQHHDASIGGFGGVWYGAGSGFGPRHRPPFLELAKAPLIAIESFTIGSDEDSDLVTLELETDYRIDDFHPYPRLIPTSGNWPAVVRSPMLIRVRYTAGYTADSDGLGTIPFTIRQAIMLTLADWYMNREDSVDKQHFNLPNGAQALLRPRRIRLGAA